VGFLANTAYTLLPLVLRDFARGFPGVTLDLRELTIPQQLEALRRENIDVGLLRPPVADDELAADTILEEPFVLALPAAHALCAQRRIPLRSLADEPFVLFPRSPGFVFHDLIGLVSAGLGVALVPASAQKIGLPGVVYRPVRESTPLACIAIARRRADPSPVVAAFLDVARRAARSL
jgi:DNA-binding transcriptional LysR family regulator